MRIEIAQVQPESFEVVAGDVLDGLGERIEPFGQDLGSAKIVEESGARGHVTLRTHRTDQERNENEKTHRESCIWDRVEF